MRRDMTLIARILRYAEGNASLTVWSRIPKFDGYTDAEVHYHIGLCIQAEYLQNTKSVPFNGRCLGVGLLTWAGHEALDRLDPCSS